MPTPTTTAGMDLRRLLSRGERVFASCPQVGRYFPAASIEDARRRLSRTIDRGDGLGLVIGGAGTGKSLLLQVLAAQYHERFDVVLLAAAPICTRRALLQAILFELGLPYRVRDEGELRLSLLDHLLSAKESPAGLLLLVDEAQALSVALLDELRVMTNLVRGGIPRVRVILAGSSTLEESFTNPDLESFSQRLSSRCYLAPLSRNETSQFIRAQVAASGGAPDDIFVGDACSAVFDATDGVPRLVNQLCDRALVMAEMQNVSCIDRDLIQAAWSDLQQLPTPWESDSTSTAPPSTQVIEFGCLNDDQQLADQVADEMADVEPTELDSDEEPVGALPPVENKQSAGERTGDPFAEQFDEEEVVLDSFAPWDDAFRRETLRVENRRDPGFASLVQDALDRSPAGEIDTDGHSLAAAEQPFCHVALPLAEASDEESDLEVVEVTELGSTSDEPSFDEPPQEWAPLRLAIVSDPAPLLPIPLVPPAGVAPGHSAAFDPVLPEDEDLVATDWPTRFAGGQTEMPRVARTYADVPVDAEPILVIEEDPPVAASGKPQVRREEYRHLFSRLRSG